MNPDPAPPTSADTPPARERTGVWHSTLATKAAGKVSALAVVETLLACAGCWWIAFRYDTHWHLLASILIAPLLLLRSPESIKLGVEWFLSRPFENWKEWSRGRRWAWLALFAIASSVAAYLLCDWLAPLPQLRLTALKLFGGSVTLFYWALSVGVVVAFAASGDASGP